MTLTGRLDPANLRVALWTLRAGRHARRELSARGVNFVALPTAPTLPDAARRVVTATLARTGASCLERAAVLQAWDQAHGHGRDLVVGVTKPSAGFRAHAWLDGDGPCHAEAFTELLRLPPRPPRDRS